MDCGDNVAVTCKTSQIVDSIIDEFYLNYAMLNFIEVYLNALEFEIECILLIRRVSEWKYMEKTDNRVMIPPCKAIVPKVNLTAYIFCLLRFSLLQQWDYNEIATYIFPIQILIMGLKPFSGVSGIDAVKVSDSYKDLRKKICVKPTLDATQDQYFVSINTELREYLINTTTIGINTELNTNSIGIGINSRKDSSCVGISASRQDLTDTNSIGININLKKDSTSFGINTDPIQDTILSVLKLPFVFNYSLWKGICGDFKFDFSASILNCRYSDAMLNLDPALDYIKACLEPFDSSHFVKTVLKDLGKTFLNNLIPCPI